MSEYNDAKHIDSLEHGTEFQDFVCYEMFKRGIILQNYSSRRYQFKYGENIQGYEIKLDQRHTDTGRLSIEVAEKTRNDPSAPWVPSGILRSDNTWLYIQGNRELLFIFAKQFLLNYYQTQIEPHGEERINAKRGTIKTFYLSHDLARRHAAKEIRFVEKIQTRGTF